MRLTILGLAMLVATSVFAQKPEWVDNPGSYSNENFVAVSVVKEKNVEKARDKASKKALKGLEKMLKQKYPKKDLKKAMSLAKIESYYSDDKYTYALCLMPIEAIDKDYAKQKNMDKARGNALNAAKMLNDQTKDKDADVIVVSEDEEIDE